MRLSICIPTYNFGEFIGATLESILPQVREGVEVVVLDGGSSDNTASVVKALQADNPSLRYERQTERGGIDRDMARTVSLARGEYCWLFCADDLMKPGAIDHMLRNLESGCDVYICGLTMCTLEMQPVREHPVARIKSEAQFDLSAPNERRRYFRRAETTTAFFSFAGSLTFRKSRWDEVELDERFVGSLWAHVARFFALIPRGLRLGYLPDSYLLKRTDNDSFMDKGIVNRYGIAIDGYHRLASTFFGERSFEARHVHRVLTNEFPPWALLAIKFGAHGAEDLDTLDRLAAKAYQDPTPRNLLYRLTYRHTPRAAFAAVRAGYRGASSLASALRTRRRREPLAAER
jgi:abequosyltransferase